MKIAVMGMGAMGSRMAARLVEAGHEVTVWNRTPRQIAGARLAQSPKAAAAGAEMVISMLRDDAASADVWLGENGALAGMAAGTMGIECSTLTPEHVRGLHQAAETVGVGFLDAPLAGSRPQAAAGQLIFMAGGADADLARAEPILLAMGAAVHHAGAAGAGASVKLMINTLFAAQIAVMAEWIGLADKAGLDAARAVEIALATPVASPAIKAASAAMLAGNFAAAFPIDLVRKDMGMALEAGKVVQADLPIARAVHATFAAADQAGYGDDNITGVVQMFRQ